MKTTILSLLAFAFAQGTQAQQMSTIRGKFTADEGIKRMTVYKVENAECKELATANVDKNGNFAFAIFPEKEGFYAVGRHPKSHMNRYVFYLKPGDNVNFTAGGDDYQFSADNTKENLAMAKWHEAVKQLEQKAVYFNKSQSTFRDFFPLLEQKAPLLAKMPKAKTGNKTFDRAFEDYKHYNLADIALAFLNTPRTEHPKATDYTPFYHALSIADYSRSTSLLDYPEGIGLIENIQIAHIRMDSTLTQEQFAQKFKTFRADALEAIVDPTVKGEFVIAGTSAVKTYPGMVSYQEKYAKYLVGNDQRTRLQQIVATLDKNLPGNPAAPFTLPDTKGKMHSLADFRGKLVYIDFWATWCGPCKREIPYMTKLEEDYAGNPDIVFVSVSVDKEADKQKWIDMVGEKGMKGLQLFTGDLKAQVSEPYHINAIPRFVLVGRDGKLINGDAPRPSTDEIRSLIDYHLKKK